MEPTSTFQIWLRLRTRWTVLLSQADTDGEAYAAMKRYAARFPHGVPVFLVRDDGPHVRPTAYPIEYGEPVPSRAFTVHPATYAQGRARPVDAQGLTKLRKELRRAGLNPDALLADPHARLAPWHLSPGDRARLPDKLGAHLMLQGVHVGRDPFTV